MNKKFILLSAAFLSAALLLVACSKEGSEYEELLAKEFAKDQDVIDYKLDPEDMANCVVDQISGDIPGFSGSPIYENYFKGYKLLLRPDDSSEIAERMEKAEEIFGSKKAANKARLDVINHILYCMPQVKEKNRGGLFNFGDDE
ncbi:MAG: hypothetical protein V3V22_03635 [Methylococcales bacterium]